ncbi:YafY family protein [Clostridium rectalis]|uniref:helix-turn-helix transcriptional regulator n=1 Tax=Clostridium rectalis TaxID=2040295 RepID=UPI00311A99EB
MSVIKIDRLIGILTILLQKERVTAPELSKKFEVSRRTINRDIEDLCKAGIPLVTSQGVGGGICIAEGYKVDKTLFTSKEIQSIFAGLKSLDSVSGDSKYKQLVYKIFGREVVDAEDNVYDESGHILIDLASHYKGTLAPKIELIRAAIDESKVIEFDYYCYSGESTRVVEPYLLVFQWSSWYIWGFCRNRKDFRLFKLNRLLNLRSIEEVYTKREV